MRDAPSTAGGTPAVRGHGALARSILPHRDPHLHVRFFELLEVALRPFDQLHAGAGEELGDADLQPFAAVLRQAIAVDVDDRRRAGARVLVHDGERGRGDFVRVGAELRGDRAREKGFARTEVADEMDDGIGSERPGDRASRRFGLGLGRADELHAPRTF